MKKLIFSLLVIGMVLSNSCKSDTNKSATAISGTIQSSLPSDEKILNAIKNKDIQIVGKRKVSDNEYYIYYSRGGEINYSPYILLSLDNGIWLINNPGYYINRIE
jgi:hypothetical protein